MSENVTEIPMRVGRGTPIGKLAGAMAVYREQGANITLTAVGPLPVMNALKASETCGRMLSETKEGEKPKPTTTIFLTSYLVDENVGGEIKKVMVLTPIFDVDNLSKLVIKKAKRHEMRVKSKTPPEDLANALLKSYQEGFDVSLLPMGAPAVNSAVKGIQRLQEKLPNKKVYFCVEKKEVFVERDNQDKTAYLLNIVVV